ncbi:MAG: leucine-rich repeat protein [Clostridia bacterium]|nr:leucine-rich repeat protein [Clostridia bacterium]
MKRFKRVLSFVMVIFILCGTLQTVTAIPGATGGFLACDITGETHTDADNDYICDECGEDAVLIEIRFDNYSIVKTDFAVLYANGDLFIDGVESIEVYDSYYDFAYDEVKRVFISENIYYIDELPKMKNNKEFIVSPQNPWLKSDGGAVFTKDGKEMVCYPDGATAKNYTIPDGTQMLSDDLFYENDYLESVTLPESVVNIGYCFYSPKMYANAYTENHVTYIGDIAVDSDFDFEETYDKVVIKPGTKIIAADAVTIYNSGIEIELPDSLTAISDNALDFDADKITLPKNLKFFGYGNGWNLYDILVDKDNPYFKSVNGVLFNKDLTELVRYPDGKDGEIYQVPSTVKTIGRYAFYFTWLDSLILPQGLEVIEKGAFYYCDVSYWSADFIQENVRYIGPKAFIYSGFEALIIPESTEYVGEFAFGWGDEGQFDGEEYDSNFLAVFRNPDCTIGKQNKKVMIMCESGSKVEQTAKENGNVFEAIDSPDHKHIYIPIVEKLPTCTEEGQMRYVCVSSDSEILVELSTEYHDYDEEYVCVDCGFELFDKDCKCICHKLGDLSDDSGFFRLIYMVVRMFWRMFGIHDVCSCRN